MRYASTLKSAVLPAVVLTLALVGSPALAAPDLIPVQGVLADRDGEPIDGFVDLHFSLYDSESGEFVLWTESYTGADQVEVVEGHFTVYLGSVAGLYFEDLLGLDELWLGLQVESDSEMPRVRMASVPYALEAMYSRSVGGLTADELQARLNIDGDVTSGACPVGEVLQAVDPETGAITCISVDAGGHDHDDLYSPIGHHHDDAYAAIGHDHDDAYSPLGHHHDDAYSPLGHHHDDAYSPLGHHHDDAYSPLGHHHDDAYSPLGHHHDDAYMAMVTCPAGNVLKWDGSAWTCAEDADTTYTAGPGLVLEGARFDVDFGATAATVAEGDHDHDEDYMPLLSCDEGDLLRWDDEGWACVEQSAMAYTAGTGLILEGARFEVDFGTDEDTVATGDHTHDDAYSPIGHHHDDSYATIGHDHDDAYSPLGHDHDEDYMPMISCPAGNVLKWEGSAWTCAEDADTTYHAGHGLILDAPLFEVDFGTTATTVATGDHTHDDAYSPLGHDHDGDYMPMISCPAGNVLKWDGSAWTCAEDANTTYTAGPGLTLSDTTFAANIGTTDGTVAAGDHTHRFGDITGTLPLDRGGTGATTSDGARENLGAAPSRHAHDAADITSGTLAVARGGTGISSYTSGNFIQATGANTLGQRTPAQVRDDISAVDRAGDTMTGDLRVNTHIGVGAAPNSDNRIFAYHTQATPVIVGQNADVNTDGLAGVAGFSGADAGTAAAGYLGAKIDGQRAGIIGVEGSTGWAGYFHGRVEVDGRLRVDGSVEVDGDATISGDAQVGSGSDYTYTSTRTGYLQLNSAGFSMDPREDDVGTWSYDYIRTGRFVLAFHNVNLPDGVTVNRIECRVMNDTGAFVRHYLYLMRQTYDSSDTRDVLGGYTDLPSATVTQNILHTGSHTIDNETNSYILEFFHGGDLHFGLRFYGCRIRYTYDRLNH